MKKILILPFLLMLNLLFAEVSLPYIFSDNMVLQRNSEIIIWGKASKNEIITLSFKNEKRKVTTSQEGNWKARFDPSKEGGPYEMVIQDESGKTIIFKNILIGDVWLASGQSNMEWNLASADGYQEELKQSEFPLIRHFKIQKSINSLPQDNILESQWNVANTSTIGDFSAVAYFFAKKMYKENHVPIGIINSTWGGTVIETWIPRTAFEKSNDFKEMISKIPQLNIEELQKNNIEKKTIFVENLLKSKISDFSQQQFLSNNYDDDSLTEIDVPKPWESQGFVDLDGLVWLRKVIELSEEDLNGDATIYLGQIDDEDVTYFNGKIIGQMNQWSDNRVYHISKDILKKGKNLIVVRVRDTGGGGGFWSDPETMKLVTSKRNISLAGKWKISVEKIFEDINQNEYPSLIYNAMIHPINQIKTSGIIWYQGESNADRAAEYQKSFPLLINSWREQFGKNLPFYFVQISSFKTPGENSNEGSPWAELRDAQTKTLHLKNTGMVVTTDIGNPEDIHPRNKKNVGERLANLALKNTLISPVYQKMSIDKNLIKINFSPDVRLKIKDSDTLNGFEIAGENQIFYPAKAIISGNQIHVFDSNVPKPVAVRYGWKGDDSQINLFSESDLPVSPFRTDDFKLSTEGKK